MRKSSVFLCSILCNTILLTSVNAQEIKITQDNNTQTALSIYNNNLGFVKDTRKAILSEGKSTIAFEGVSEKMKAETAMLNGSGISVLEQNYDYAVLTPASILSASVGEKVKIATTNPKTGEDILTPAVVVTSNYGTPVLKFDYGYEAYANGRIIYDKLPENLRIKPTLIITLNNETAGEKEIELAYLTQGLSWTANYIAEITTDDKLNLNGLVTLTNESGTDYKDAKIQLIAGDVKQEMAQPIMMKRRFNAMADSIAMESDSTLPQKENIADYHMYTLPYSTTITDKQVKQVSLMNKPNIKFEKKYLFSSPLSLSPYSKSGFFEEQNPQVVFKIINNKADGLGEPIPAGIVRLYQNDKNGNLQYIGEDNIKHTPEGGKIELETGNAFDIMISGKTTESLKLSNDVRQQSIEINFQNSSNHIAKIDFSQDFNYEHTLVSESQTSELENPNRRVWKIELAPQSNVTLNFSVRVNKQ